MLNIQNLHAQITEESKPVLNGVSLQVNPGEVHFLLGPNGSGKSSLGRILLGDETYEMTQGKITLNGEDMTDLNPSQRTQNGFYLSFQSPPEINGVTVSEFLFAAKKAHDPDFASSYKFKKNLKEQLNHLRLTEDFADREMNVGFSGGERKKMEIASMLMLEPTLAFLDEIDSGVDIDTLKTIGKTLQAYYKNSHRSLILVTHSEKLLETLTPTHVHIFNQGKIIESGQKELVNKIITQGFDAFIPENKGFSMS